MKHGLKQMNTLRISFVFFVILVVAKMNMFGQAAAFSHEVQNVSGDVASKLKHLNPKYHIYKPDKIHGKLPLVIYLHGVGIPGKLDQREEKLKKLKQQQVVGFYKKNRKFSFILAVPQHSNVIDGNKEGGNRKS